MARVYEYRAEDEAALKYIAMQLLDNYLIDADADEIEGDIASVKLKQCNGCDEFNLDENACADHKGECYSCCGCGLLENEVK